ncbi:stress response protein NST1-like [Nicotiana sylvestris]|uniref:Glutamic acid-rich protein-like n=1 Tax=Nicotiana sylvestris TaxID=4096 RepID=A0A1U7WF22_NICSY|nr:PREDICTED: glutamic acid-rich protein-like [Nicotiana sylvestris]
MSRCFPYPPPGYSLNTAANNEALIESIKLQREREIAKAEKKKEKKREKKEKRREEKKAKKESSNPGFDKATHESKGMYLFKCLEDEAEQLEREKKEKKQKRREEKKAKKESSNPGFDKATHESKGMYLFKCLEDEAEQLERSNLTEEHGQAVCSQNSSCSSDSTQNSNKRKRPASPSHGNIQAHGSIIRIRLSKKDGQGKTSTAKEKQLRKPAQKDVEVTVRTSVERANPLLKATNNQGCPSPSVLEPSPSTSGWRDCVAVDKAATASCSKAHENSIEFQYRNLIENWLPPSLQTEHLDVDGEAWLFQRKPKHTRVGEKSAVSKEVSNDSTCGSSALWPRAQYIHDAELYALPFTVPF